MRCVRLGEGTHASCELVLRVAFFFWHPSLFLSRSPRMPVKRNDRSMSLPSEANESGPYGRELSTTPDIKPDIKPITKAKAKEARTTTTPESHASKGRPGVKARISPDAKAAIAEEIITRGIAALDIENLAARVRNLEC